MLLSPEYTRIGLNRRIAIPRALYNDAMRKFDRGLPFDNLFGSGVNRIVIPFENEKKKEISDAVGKLGYGSIDWIKGEAIKTILPHPDARLPDGSVPPPKERRVSLGKVLGSMPDGLELRNWYTDNQASLKTDAYSIIISRHPVDVVRMSDHRNINTSCHAQGGSRWLSCLGEMAHGGLVTYLVKTEDLQEIQDKIPGKDEIFYDGQRDVQGIVPLSRNRIRRYTHQDRSFDLAVPELKVYGQQNDAFAEQVDNWTRKVQEPLLSQKRWPMEEFIRRGGKYPDNPDGLLFNSFFGDDLDSDRDYADYGIAGQEAQYGEWPLTAADPEDDEDEDDEDEEEDEEAQQEVRNEEMRADIDRIDRTWSRRLVYCSVSFDENEADYGEETSFYWSGSMSVELAENLITEDALATINSNSYVLLDRQNDSLKDYLNDNGFYVDGEINFVNYAGKAIFTLGLDNGDGSPDDYDSFCDSVNDDWDDKHDEIKGHIVQWLMNHGFAETSPVREFSYADAQFQNFEVYFDGGTMEAIAEAPIGVFEPGVFSLTLVQNDVESAVRNLVSQELAKIIQTRKHPTGYFPGFQPETPVETKENYNLSNFSLNLRKSESYQKQIMLEITFKADDLTTAEDMEEVIELMRVVDRIFPRIVNESMKLLENYYTGVKEQRKREDAEYGQPV